MTAVCPEPVSVPHMVTFKRTDYVCPDRGLLFGFCSEEYKLQAMHSRDVLDLEEFASQNNQMGLASSGSTLNQPRVSMWLPQVASDAGLCLSGGGHLRLLSLDCSLISSWLIAPAATQLEPSKWTVEAKAPDRTLKFHQKHCQEWQAKEVTALANMVTFLESWFGSSRKEPSAAGPCMNLWC